MNVANTSPLTLRSSVLMSSKGHNPRAMSSVGFPTGQSFQAQLRYLLQYAVLAPSTQNSQPWLFQVSGSSIFLYADRSRALPIRDPHVRSQIMSCGAAQFNYESALKAYGFDFKSTLFPEISDADLLVRTDVHGRSHPDVRDDVLCSIRHRITANSGFVAALDASDADVMPVLSTCARNHSASLRWLTREEIKALSVHVQQQQEPNEHWDELPGEKPGAYPFFGESGEDETLAVLSTRGDRLASWLRAGEAMQSVLLEATSRGIAVSLLSVETLRPTLIHITKQRETPQLLMRFGYAR